MKKLLSILLAAVLLVCTLSLAACGKIDPDLDVRIMVLNGTTAITELHAISVEDSDQMKHEFSRS